MLHTHLVSFALWNCWLASGRKADGICCISVGNGKNRQDPRLGLLEAFFFSAICLALASWNFLHGCVTSSKWNWSKIFFHCTIPSASPATLLGGLLPCLTQLRLLGFPWMHPRALQAQEVGQNVQFAVKQLLLDIIQGHAHNGLLELLRLTQFSMPWSWSHIPHFERRYKPDSLAFKGSFLLSIPNTLIFWKFIWKGVAKGIQKGCDVNNAFKDLNRLTMRRGWATEVKCSQNVTWQDLASFLLATLFHLSLPWLCKLGVHLWAQGDLFVYLHMRRKRYNLNNSGRLFIRRHAWVHRSFTSATWLSHLYKMCPEFCAQCYCRLLLLYKYLVYKERGRDAT